MYNQTKDINTVEDLLEHPVELIHATGGLSLIDFMELFWDEVAEGEFKKNWHIEYLCNELETIARHRVTNKPKLHDLIINIPPGTTKTLTCSVMFPAWCWAEVAYWFRFITASYSSTLSLESAEKSRDIILSDKFKMLYPDLTIKQDKNTKSNFRVMKKEHVHPGKVPRLIMGGGRVSTSVGATVTGFHGDILIVDDPLNPEQAASEQELIVSNRWMDQTLPTRTTDKDATPTILIMQRLHQKDPTGNLLGKKLDDLKHICLPGELEEYGEWVKPVELKQRYIDGLLDPIRLSYKALKGLKAKLGQYGYAGQVGQKPTPPGGGMFKIDNIAIIDSLPSPANFIQVVRYWDKAATEYKKENRVGARTAGVKIARLQNGKFIILDCKRGAWATEQREQIIKSTAEADDVVKGRLNNLDVDIYVEQEPGSGGKDSARGTITNLAGYRIYADRPSGDKIYRADPFSVQVNEGNVMMLRGEWNKDYLDEMENFPFSGTKDQIDASSGAFSKLVGKKIARRIR